MAKIESIPGKLVIYNHPWGQWIQYGVLALICILVSLIPLQSLFDPQAVICSRSIVKNCHPRSFTDVLLLITACAGFSLVPLSFLLHGSRITTCTFDKTTGIVKLEARGVLGTKIIEYKLHWITDVIVREFISKAQSVSAIPSEQNAHVLLKLVSGRFFTYLGVYQDVYSGNWKQEAEHVAGLIREFLDLPSIDEAS